VKCGCSAGHAVRLSKSIEVTSWWLQTHFFRCRLRIVWIPGYPKSHDV